MTRASLLVLYCIVGVWGFLQYDIAYSRRDEVMNIILIPLLALFDVSLQSL